MLRAQRQDAGPVGPHVGGRDGDAAQGVVSTGGANARPEALPELLDLVAQGEVLVSVDAEYTLDDVQSAFAEVAGGHVRGKVIVTVE